MKYFALCSLNRIFVPQFVEELPVKRNTRNQKQFEKLLVLRYEDIKLTIGLQRSNQDLVQYCITVPKTMSQSKAINSGE